MFRTDTSTRTWRISASLALAFLVPLALVESAGTQAAAAKPPERRAHADATPPALQAVLDAPAHVAASVRHQAPTTPPKAPEPSPRERPATRPTPRPTATVAAERVNRSLARPALAQAAPTLAGAQGFARSQMSSAQFACLSNIVKRESGWNPYARNPSSGAYGLFQALPGSKMRSAGSDWATNPLTQMRWGISYVHSRYGSPCGAWHFWQRNRWY